MCMCVQLNPQQKLQLGEGKSVLFLNALIAQIESVVVQSEVDTQYVRCTL